MIHYSSFALFISFFSGTCALAQSYTIYGNCANCADQWVYITYNNDKLQEKIDSARVENGRFFFGGKVEEPTHASLTFEQTRNYSDFFIENTTINISVDTAVRFGAMFSGGKSNAELRSFHQERAVIKQDINYWQTMWVEAKKSGDTVLFESSKKEWEAGYARLSKAERGWVEKNPDSYMSAVIISNNYTHPDNLLTGDTLLKNLTLRIRQSKEVRLREARVNRMKAVEVGNPVVHFSQTDSSGKTISTKDFGGNYLLIDFWASWCGPCRQENPAVVNAYQKYHTKGLEILGVSLDSDRKSWVAAIHKDNLTWSQVSDLKGWKNEAAELYSVRGIPANFLISPEGKIIERDLRGDDLEDKLKKILDR